jgi:hypothetical protein
MITAQTSLATQCNSGGQQFEVHQCRGGMLCISSGQSEEVLDEEYTEEDKISCVDINFDGEPDILVEHPPTGQIRLSSVFIFDRKEKTYRKNQALSNTPCLKIDTDKKSVSGECFSSSACDRWSEQYKISGNSLELVSTKGTYCDPATGEAYSYFEIYEDGQMVEKTVEPLTEGK